MSDTAVAPDVANAQLRRVRCTSAERVLAFVHDELEGDGMVTAIARCAGLLRSDRLRIALDRLQARHAKLTAGIVTGDDGWPYFRFQRAAPPIPCDFRVAASDDDWMQAVLQDRPGAFSPNTVPLVRFLVLTHPQRNLTDVIVWCHHSIADGLSIWTMIVELLRFYADPAWSSEAAPDGLSLFIPLTPSRLQRWKRLLWYLALEIEERWRHRVHLPVDEDAPPGTLVRRIFNEDETAALVSRCRLENVTVFAALSASAFFAIAEEYQWFGREIAFNAPLSIREHLRPEPPSAETLGAFVTTLRGLTRLPSIEESFWNIARRFRNTWSKSLREKDPIQGLRMLDRLPMRRQSVAKPTATVSINSLGRLKQEILRGEPSILDFTWFGRAAIGGSPFTVYATTVADRFNFTVRSERQKPDRVARICDRLHARLREAIYLRGC